MDPAHFIIDKLQKTSSHIKGLDRDTILNSLIAMVLVYIILLFFFFLDKKKIPKMVYDKTDIHGYNRWNCSIYAPICIRYKIRGAR